MKTCFAAILSKLYVKESSANSSDNLQFIINICKLSIVPVEQW